MTTRNLMSTDNVLGPQHTELHDSLWPDAYKRKALIAPKLAEALRAMLAASMELADNAGDVPEWNDGGIAHEACKTARAALAEWDAS